MASSLSPTYLRMYFLVVVAYIHQLFFLLSMVTATQMLTYHIVEEQPVGTVVGDLVADGRFSDVLSSADIARLRFNVLRAGAAPSTPSGVADVAAASGYFVVAEPPQSGVLTTGAVIDRDRICPGREHCRLAIEVAALIVGGGGGDFFRMMSVVIDVEDLNDNAPSFQIATEDKEKRITISLPESVVPNSAIQLPMATDSDSPANGVVRYELSQPPAVNETCFRLEYVDLSSQSEPQLRLVVVQPLDREHVTLYSLNITAVDGGGKCSAAIFVDVHIDDVNDNAPRFERRVYIGHVTEGRVTEGHVTEGHVTEGGDLSAWSDTSLPIVRVRASDSDSGENGHVTYRLQASLSHSADLFAINQQTGDVTLITGATDILDRESVSQYVVVVLAVDGGLPTALTSSATLVVLVDDVNDNAPQISVEAFTPDEGAPRVAESAEVGSFVALVSVIDPDATGDNSNVSCSLGATTTSALSSSTGGATAADTKRIFSIIELPPAKYKMITSDALDYETSRRHDVIIICHDHGLPNPLSSTVALTIDVADVNDNDPQFTNNDGDITHVYDIIIAENDVVDDVLIKLTATDEDSGENARLEFSFIADDRFPDLEKYFRVDSVSGDVIALTSFDYEATQELRVTVAVSDHGSPTQRMANATLTVHVTDRNDEPPNFTTAEYRFHVAEDQPSGTTIGLLSAVDLDRDAPNNWIQFSLLVVDDENIDSKYDDDDDDDDDGDAETKSSTKLFTVDRNTGAIVTTSQLNREVRAVYRLLVEAADGGVPNLRGRADVIVFIDDCNDNSPIFDLPSSTSGSGDIRIQIPRSLRRGSAVLRLVARDLDVGPNADLSFDLLSDGPDDTFSKLFVVDSKTGVVSVNENLDFAERHLDDDVEVVEEMFSLRFRVSDGGNPSLSVTVSVSVVVNRSLNYDVVGDNEGIQSGEGQRRQDNQLPTKVIGRNTIVLIFVVFVSAVAIFCLLSCIVIVLYRQRRRRQMFRDKVDCKSRHQKFGSSDASGTVTNTPSSPSLDLVVRMGKQWQLTSRGIYWLTASEDNDHVTVNGKQVNVL